MGHLTDSAGQNIEIDPVYLQDTCQVYAKQLETEDKRLADAKAESETSVQVQMDDTIVFIQFSKNSGSFADEYDQDLSRAIASLDDNDRIVQIVGVSEKVYAEAVVNVHQYDIFMDVLIVN